VLLPITRHSTDCSTDFTSSDSSSSDLRMPSIRVSAKRVDDGRLSAVECLFVTSATGRRNHSQFLSSVLEPAS
jgi:hypothetical protein